ncbi:MAG TPA: LuxR C-terminal-related transcriptional regulator [Pseudonocardia sp.]
MPPPTRSPQPRTATNLPATITSFVGRRQELADARRLLGSGRLVTLTGAGGVGKTRLALRLASDLVKGFADGGVWWVELANTRGHEAVAHAVADAVGLRNQPEMPLAEALAELLADRHILVVLDNCEHLIESCSSLVHDLLRRCPRLHVLATSREPLGITGEFILPVPPLSFPAPDRAAGADRADPDTLTSYDSVNLFVERASAGCPGFRLTEDNAASVLRICQEIEGIPLAIELAAVRVRSLPLDSILRRLKDHSAGASGATRNLPRHHRTLRASVEWSYELCSASERTIWARLSAFAGGFDLDAATSICAGPGMSVGQVTDAIAALHDKSILLCTANGTAAHGQIRYRMLEILREFGQERLTEAGELTEVHRRHRDWYLALTEHAYACWLGPEQPALVGQLREDYRNLRAAFTFSQSQAGGGDGSDGGDHGDGGDGDHGGDHGTRDGADAALMMASALEHYWLIRGWQTEGRQWLDAALERGTEPSRHRARALRVNAYLTALQGAAAHGYAMVEEARTIAGQHDDQIELAYINMVHGMLEMCSARLPEAQRLFERALDRFSALEHPQGEAYTLVMLVALAAAKVDRELAERCHARCMALTEPRGEVHLRGFSLWGCGLAALRAGDTARALELERTALQLKSSLEDQLGTTLAMEVLAWIEVAEERDDRAAALLGATEQLWSPMSMTVKSILDFGRFREEYDRQLAMRISGRKFEAAYRRGTRMSLGQALPFALGTEDAGPGAGSAETNPLTRREREIAEQVAKGHTNRRIALELTVSQRTVEGHVEKIMTKLGFSSRTQIAAWATEHRAS